MKTNGALGVTSAITIAFLSLVAYPPTALSFQWSTHPVKRTTLSTGSNKIRLWGSRYGRGAEIWPPTNIESPVRLEDSFPPGYVSATILQDLNNSSNNNLEEASDSTARPDNVTTTTSSSPSRRRKRDVIWNILKRAARLQQRSNVDNESIAQDLIESQNISPQGLKKIDESPAVLAILLLLMGLIHPTDGLFVLGFSGYLTLLYKWSKSTPDQVLILSNIPTLSYTNNKRVLMPSLPPQGHVPSLIANPLGHMLTDSPIYRTWLRTGAIVGLLAPLGWVGWYIIRGNRDAARLCASPVFLLCCQALSEAAARRSSVC